MPCRHFEVVAPGDGILRVNVVWTPNIGAEGVNVILAGVSQSNPFNWNAPVGSHRVLAGTTYGITVVYHPSHYEYVSFLAPDRIGEFTLTTSFEPRMWR